MDLEDSEHKMEAMVLLNCTRLAFVSLIDDFYLMVGLL